MRDRLSNVNLAVNELEYATSTVAIRKRMAYLLSHNDISSHFAIADSHTAIARPGERVGLPPIRRYTSASIAAAADIPPGSTPRSSRTSSMSGSEPGTGSWRD